ncbi:MAG: flagellar hook assembly protein FlgD [Gammaproteobacteria bacterium]
MTDAIRGGGIEQALSIARAQTSNETEQTEKNQFLNLLVAQLKNQNPLDPQDGAEFLSQLAQFSTVDGIERLNDSMGDLSNGFRSGQALQATALVGRQVEVDSRIVQLEATGEVSGRVMLDQPVADIQVQIRNAAGVIVREMPFGPHEAGELNVRWDGLDETGVRAPAGHYELVATGVSGEETVQLKTQVGVNVDSVTLGQQGEVTLNLRNQTSVPLSAVQQVN